MANKDRPNGFKPHGEVKRSLVMTAGEAIYPGDAVVAASDGKVDVAATGDTDVMGVALSYASGDGEDVLVSVDPDQIYEVQADEDDINAQTDIYQTADVLATAGDSTYKISRQELDSDSIGSSQQFVILGIVKEPDNALGDKVNVLVKINRNNIFGETDSAGV